MSEAFDSLYFVEDHQPQYLAYTRDRLKQLIGLLLMDLRMLGQVIFHLPDLFIQHIDQFQVRTNAQLHARMLEA